MITIKDYSEQFNQYYESEDVIYCKDRKQQVLYIKNHAKLADVTWGTDENNNLILILVFWRDENTRELYKKWKAHELT